MADKQHIFTGIVAPDAAPTEVGHHYVDTVAGDHYLSVGTATVADWALLGSGTGGLITYTDTWPLEEEP